MQEVSGRVEEGTSSFESVTSEIIEKLSSFVFGARFKSKSVNESLKLNEDLPSCCEHLNANLAYTIDVILCPKDNQPGTVDSTHQLLERWILAYEPSVSTNPKLDVVKPVPKSLDALTFLVRSLGGYAGSMPLHTMLKDAGRFSFLYGIPSPSCAAHQELTFAERPSVFLFAPLKTACGTFTFSVKFKRKFTLAEKGDYNLILQPSFSSLKYTCNHGTSPPSTPLAVVPKTESRKTSPPVNIPKLGRLKTQSEDVLSSPSNSPFNYESFLASPPSAAPSMSAPSQADSSPYIAQQRAQREPPKGIERPLSYSNTSQSSCRLLYSSPPPIRRPSLLDSGPRVGASRLRESGGGRSKLSRSYEEEVEDEDGADTSFIKRRVGFEKEAENDDFVPPLSKLGPSPSDLLGPFVGSFEESILNGRMCDTPSTPFEGFSYDVAVSGRNYASKHIRKDFTAIYYNIQEDTPYVATLDLRCKNPLGLRIPVKGIFQATIFNPTRTPIKTFLVKYDLEDMPVGTKTFLRQKMVTPTAPSIIRYAVHLRFSCPARKKYFLRNDVRVLFPHRMPDDMDELKIVYDCPVNPKYFPS